MKVVLFGATGMIGQGVLRECLLAPAVTEVLTVGRAPTGKQHAKLREVTHADLGDLTAIEGDLRGADACFFCLGVSSAGMSEDAYRRITYDYTMAAARVFAALDPEATFVYVSGAGTDSTERGRSMWARVKGKTENDVLALLPNAYMFRPATSSRCTASRRGPGCTGRCTSSRSRCTRCCVGCSRSRSLRRRPSAGR